MPVVSPRKVTKSEWPEKKVLNKKKNDQSQKATCLIRKKVRK